MRASVRGTSVSLVMLLQQDHIIKRKKSRQSQIRYTEQEREAPNKACDIFRHIM